MVEWKTSAFVADILGKEGEDWGI
jgi:hypothetical protein